MSRFKANVWVLNNICIYSLNSWEEGSRA